MKIIEELNMFYREEIQNTLFIYDNRTNEIKEVDDDSCTFDCTGEEEKLIINDFVLTNNNCTKLLAMENVFIIAYENYVVMFIGSIPAYIKYLCKMKDLEDFYDIEDSKTKTALCK